MWSLTILEILQDHEMGGEQLPANSEQPSTNPEIVFWRSKYFLESIVIIIIIPRWAGPNDPPKLALILPRWAGPNDPRRLASNILRLEINRGVRLGISDLSFYDDL